MPTVDYTPPPTLERFMRSDNEFRLVMGPYGSGKSSCCCIEILRRCAEQAPGLDGKRRSKWAVIRNTADQLRDTTFKTWCDWFPVGEFGHYIASSKTYVLQLGSIEAEIVFRALDDPDDVRKLKSFELTGAWLNEASEIHPDIISPLRKRVGRYPSQKNRPADIPKENWPTWYGVIADTNAPSEDSWWARMIEKEMPNDWEVFKQPSGRSPEAENVENLPKGYYDVKEGMTEDEVRVQIDGLFARSKSGMPVFKSFRREFHVAKEPLLYNPKLLLVIGLDPGMNTAAIIGQQDLYGRVRILDELITQGVGAARFADDYLKPLLKNRYPDADVLITPDPAAENRSQADEQTVVSVLRRRGFKVKPAHTNKPEARISAVDSYLTRIIDGQAAFLIDPACKKLISAMSGGYRYAINKRGVTADVPEKDEASHPCFAAGTKVLTARGEIPIEQLSAGDRVLTPEGYCPIKAVWMSSPKAEVLEVAFSNGRTMVVTPNHPFYVKGKGFIPIDAVQYQDILESVAITGERPCKDKKSIWYRSSTACGTTRNERGTIRPTTLCTNALGTCTETYGNFIKEQFRKTVAFITSTRTRLTTGSRILKCFGWLSTVPCIPDNEWSLIHNSVIGRFLKRERPQKNGTPAKQAGPGIPSTASGGGIICTLRKWYAPIAGKNIWGIRNGERKDSAQCRVREWHEKNPVLMTYSASAQPVGARTTRTSTASQKTAASLVGKKRLSAPVPVYTLAVNECPTYYAEGILVHNCDAAQYLSCYFQKGEDRLARRKEAGRLRIPGWSPASHVGY